MRQLHLRGNGDPFSLLKILQTIRDLASGEQLEIRSDHAEPLAQLLRLLPSNRCRVEMVAGPDGPPGHHLLLTATNDPAEPTKPSPAPPAGAPNPTPMEDSPQCGTCCD